MSQAERALSSAGEHPKLAIGADHQPMFVAGRIQGEAKVHGIHPLTGAVFLAHPQVVSTAAGLAVARENTRCGPSG